jgi:hypothetical protein
MVFSFERGRRPGPKGPAKELIDAVVEMNHSKTPHGSTSASQKSSQSPLELTQELFAPKPSVVHGINEVHCKACPSRRNNAPQREGFGVRATLFAFNQRNGDVSGHPIPSKTDFA